MPKRSELRVGDVIAIPLDDDRIAVGQVVGTYKKGAYYFAIFEGSCQIDDMSCVQATVDGPIALLGLSMDAKLSAGHWTMVGQRG